MPVPSSVARSKDYDSWSQSFLSGSTWDNAAKPPQPSQAPTQNIRYENGQVVIERAGPDGTIRTFKRSTRPEDNPDPLDRLALKGDFEKTRAAADLRLAFNPEDKNALWWKAESQAMLGSHADAIQAYDQLLKLDPNNAGAINNKAISVKATGDRNQSFELFKEAHKLDPNSSVIAGNLAGSYLGRGEYGQALEHVNKALKNGPEDREHKQQLETLKASLAATMTPAQPQTDDKKPVLAM